MTEPKLVDIAPGIRVLQVPEETPMRPVCTNIYLVGERELTLIDSGVDEERFSRAIFQCLLKLGRRYRVSAVALSHSHMDHQGGLRWLRESIGPEVFAHTLAESKVKNTTLKLLESGSTLEADGVSLEVHHIPGHSPDSVGYYNRESGILFTGDTILGKGTTSVHDLGPYMASLERLQALTPKTILPGHGPVVSDAEQTVASYIRHRRMREEQVLTELQRGLRSVTQLVNRIYGDIHPRLKRAARGNVRQHLAKLQAENRVLSEGAGARMKYRLT
jgi:glyoxylase-like metal-dependent hydrolase (beta-lactamase superfamily II)